MQLLTDTNFAGYDSPLSPILFSPSLRELSISSCNLTSIPQVSFARLPALQKLKLESNSISIIPKADLTALNLTRLLNKELRMLENPSQCGVISGAVLCACADGLTGSPSFCEQLCPLPKLPTYTQLAGCTNNLNVGSVCQLACVNDRVCDIPPGYSLQVKCVVDDNGLSWRPVANLSQPLDIDTFFTIVLEFACVFAPNEQTLRCDGIDLESAPFIAAKTLTRLETFEATNSSFQQIPSFNVRYLGWL